MPINQNNKELAFRALKIKPLTEKKGEDGRTTMVSNKLPDAVEALIVRAETFLKAMTTRRVELTFEQMAVLLAAWDEEKYEIEKRSPGRPKKEEG